MTLISFVLVNLLAIGGSAYGKSNSLLHEQTQNLNILQVVDDPVSNEDRESKALSPLLKQKEEEKKPSDKKAQAKPPTTMEILMETGGKQAKQAGSFGKYVTGIFSGYKQIYDEGLKVGEAKRNARIARGETPTLWTDVWDGASSTFFPSVTYTAQILWPYARAIVGALMGA